MDRGQKITPVEKFLGNPDKLTVREIEQTKRSPSTRRRIRAEIRIRRGFHPFGFPLREPKGETCGSCAFSGHHGHGKGYYKCNLMKDGGQATDLRISWPACQKWQPEAIPMKGVKS